MKRYFDPAEPGDEPGDKPGDETDADADAETEDVQARPSAMVPP
jgi:hypothetical protein